MKILIVTYTYPPAKSVNGFRPYHFARALTAAGWNVSVLTRHFTGDEQIPEDYSRPNHSPFSIDRQPEAIVYRTPFYNSWFEYYQLGWIRRTRLWKWIYFIQLLFGRTTQESYNKYFKNYLPSLLKQKNYDLILVESGPTNLVRLVARYAIRSDIPYVIDFRDLYYHEMHLKHNTLPVNKRIKLGLEGLGMRLALKHARLVFSLNQEMLNILKIGPTKGIVITNGFDETQWESISAKPRQGRFMVSIIGTLYDRPFLDIMLQAIFQFVNKNYNDVIVTFIAPGQKDLINKIRTRLPFRNVNIVENKLSYVKAITEMAESHVLIYHGWLGYRGCLSTKIYDYIRSGRRILIVPGDENGLDTLIKDFGAGVSCTTAEEGAGQLTQWYHLWAKGIDLRSEINVNKFHSLSREFQSKQLVKALENDFTLNQI